ncbi:type II toxin-antitoxin system VapC family toxin [Geobacter grbiciae]|uniref:type II toxin-antitoxin system VapC family toxin n=1 Tax=Geobacter grbiciae TaxID=155042 RepID=UPI001C0283CD|nr:type II toxin-antitoxin system VapC family toxin [Geobacter grbiciae]MBT1074874.1 type II toxin-antitoxin system VapC family toxin [Geobacter grbiciae]
MILYLDTSSLVKLYVEEACSDTVRQWVERAEAVATCRVAYPELLSALTRRHNRGDLPREDYEVVAECFAGEWEHFVALDFDEIEAGHFVRKYGLRGFDAVHLAAAKLLLNDCGAIEVAFSSFDNKLNGAAEAEGFALLAASH